jgi:hypothetical protein
VIGTSLTGEQCRSFCALANIHARHENDLRSVLLSVSWRKCQRRKQRNAV